MRYLYYCNSTYQIITAINLHYQRKYRHFENIDNYSGDIVILNSFLGASDIAKKLEKNEIFNKATLVNKNIDNGKFHIINTIIDAFFPGKCLLDNYDVAKKDIYNKYDYVVVPKYSIITDDILRLNKKAKIQLYEDGLGSYFSLPLLEPTSKIYKIIYKIFKNGGDFKNYQALYLYMPELCADDSRTIKIPSIDYEIIDIIKKIFVVNDTSSEKSVFWIAQNLENDEYKRLVEQLLNVMRKYKEYVLFRPHPRYPDAFDTSEFDVDESNDAWELKVLNDKGIENKLLISVHSTACFTPKILFNKEPYILFFYKLFDRKVSYANEKFELVLTKFISSYKNKEKIFIPETIEEFENYVNSFISKGVAK